MIINGMCDILFLLEHYNQDKKRDLILNQSRFPLYYVAHHTKSLNEGSETDQYVDKNLICTVEFLRITLSNFLLQKLLTMVQ